MKLLITPNDTLNFGRGTPSTKGENSFLAEMFPPYPSVLLGALRGSYLSSNPDDIANANEPSDPTLGFTIKHYSLMLKDEMHFPAPFDYVVFNDELNALHLRENKENERLSSMELPYYLWTDNDGKVTPSDGRWISISNLKSYLTEAPKTLHSVKLADYCIRESHIGIARELQTRTAENSMLYNVNMTRVQDLQFAVDIELNGKSLPETGILRLGSHNKSACFENNEFENDIPSSIDGMFKLYLATPAIFKLGWKPDLEEQYGLELIAAAIGGYESIGGFDMKANRPKPMCRAVKAGSVYYYKTKNSTQEHCAKLLENLHGESISEERSNEGFGLCYIGNVKGEI